MGAWVRVRVRVRDLLALERLDHGRLLTADVRPCARHEPPHSHAHENPTHDYTHTAKTPTHDYTHTQKYSAFTLTDGTLRETLT